MYALKVKEDPPVDVQGGGVAIKLIIRKGNLFAKWCVERGKQMEYNGK